MRYTVTLPRQTAEAEAYTVASWHVQIGDHVEPGDALLSVRAAETDASADGATTSAVVSPVYGVLARRMVLPGENIEVGEPLAVLSGVPEPVSAPTMAPSPPAVPAPDVARGLEEVVPYSAARRLLAEHDARSWTGSPHVVTVATADITEVERLRARVAQSLDAREGLKLGLLPFLLSVTGAVLVAHPALNATAGDENGRSGALIGTRQKRHVAIGVPLATGAGGRVAVPVVRIPEKKSIVALAREWDDLARRAHAGALTPAEQQGATFTIAPSEPHSDVLFQTTILHRPQAALLSVGAVVRTPVALPDDTVAIRPILHLCLTHDARVVTGSEAIAFLSAVKRGLEEAQFLFS